MNSRCLRRLHGGYGELFWTRQCFVHRVTFHELTFDVSRLRALVAKRDWNEIEEISKQRKSPIGWEVWFLQTTNLLVKSTTD